MIHIFFLIGTLKLGGAERQLVELVKGLDKDCFNATVAIFYDVGALRKELSGIPGVKLLSLDKAGRWDLIRFGFRLIRLLKDLRPNILYSFMPEPNLAGFVTGRLAGVPKIVWSIRASNMDVKRYNWLVGATTRIGAWISSLPDSIIINSYSGFSYHKSIGYDANRMVVIPNGINTKKFMPDRKARAMIRSEWGISEDSILIGRVARLDPMKDYETFLHAAQIFVQKENNAFFACIGGGSEHYRNELHILGKELGLKNNILWLDSRSDMPCAYNAFDILASSSSFGEGFPNVIGEAMACGIPCVVTDAGDSAEIVGGTGVVVPIGDPQALSDGWETMVKRLQSDPFLIAEKVRERIVKHFSVETLVQKTSDVLLRLL